jgi:hypothetical protein
MIYRVLFLAMTAAWVTQSSADQVDDLANGAISSYQSQQRTQAPAESGADRDLAAARRLTAQEGSGGDGQYNALVYAYYRAGMADRIDWTPDAQRAYDQQARVCNHWRAILATYYDQIKLQANELSGDPKFVVQRQADLYRPYKKYQSNVTYTCRGIDALKDARSQAQSQTIQNDPLFNK